VDVGATLPRVFCAPACSVIVPSLYLRMHACRRLGGKSDGGAADARVSGSKGAGGLLAGGKTATFSLRALLPHSYFTTARSTLLPCR